MSQTSHALDQWAGKCDQTEVKTFARAILLDTSDRLPPQLFLDYLLENGAPAEWIDLARAQFAMQNVWSNHPQYLDFKKSVAKAQDAFVNSLENRPLAVLPAVVRRWVRIIMPTTMQSLYRQLFLSERLKFYGVLPELELLSKELAGSREYNRGTALPFFYLHLQGRAYLNRDDPAVGERRIRFVGEIQNSLELREQFRDLTDVLSLRLSFAEGITFFPEPVARNGIPGLLPSSSLQRISLGHAAYDFEGDLIALAENRTAESIVKLTLEKPLRLDRLSSLFATRSTLKNLSMLQISKDRGSRQEFEAMQSQTRMLLNDTGFKRRIRDLNVQIIGDLGAHADFWSGVVGNLIYEGEALEKIRITTGLKSFPASDVNDHINRLVRTVREGMPTVRELLIKFPESPVNKNRLEEILDNFRRLNPDSKVSVDSTTHDGTQFITLNVTMR